MKIFTRVMIGTAALLFAGLVFLFAYFAFFVNDYYLKVVPGKTLKTVEHTYLNKTYNFKKDERIILFYGYGFNIEQGGAVISNYRIISYLENEDPRDSEQAFFKQIRQVTLTGETSYLEDGLITVTRKNSTEFTIPVVNSNHDSKKFYYKIKKMIKK